MYNYDHKYDKYLPFVEFNIKKIIDKYLQLSFINEKDTLLKHFEHHFELQFEFNVNIVIENDDRLDYFKNQSDYAVEYLNNTNIDNYYKYYYNFINEDNNKIYIMCWISKINFFNKKNSSIFYEPVFNFAEYNCISINNIDKYIEEYNDSIKNINTYILILLEILKLLIDNNMHNDHIIYKINKVDFAIKNNTHLVYLLNIVTNKQYYLYITKLNNSFITSNISILGLT